jgi:hypothetical protein
MFSVDEPTTAGKQKNNGKVNGAPFETVPDWNQIGTFAAGVGIGAVVGAAIALLWAPDSGEETRGRIRRKFSRDDEESLWAALGHELKRATAKRKPVEDEEVEELFEMETADD